MTLQTLRQQFVGAASLTSLAGETFSLREHQFDQVIEQSIVETLTNARYNVKSLGVDRDALSNVVYRSGPSPAASLFNRNIKGAEAELRNVIGQQSDYDIILLVVQSKSATLQTLARPINFGREPEATISLHLDLVAIDGNSKAFLGFSELGVMRQNVLPRYSFSGELARTNWTLWPKAERDRTIHFLAYRGVAEMATVSFERFFF